MKQHDAVGLGGHRVGHRQRRLGVPGGTIAIGAVPVPATPSESGPAEFDVGAYDPAMVCAIPEGEEKPLKYPVMLGAVSVVLVDKMDLLPHLDFDLDLFLRNLHSVNPDARVIQVGARTGAGLDEWHDCSRAETQQWGPDAGSGVSVPVQAERPWWPGRRSAQGEAMTTTNPTHDVSATPTVIQRLVRDLRTNLETADHALSQVHDTAQLSADVLTEDLRTTIRQLHADVSYSLTELEAATGDQRSAYLGEAGRRLSAGRGVLDELRVRASLGGDQVRQQSTLLVEATENAWLAARNRLDTAQHDAAETVDDGRTGIEKSLQDFNEALVEARAVFQRTRRG